MSFITPTQAEAITGVAATQAEVDRAEVILDVAAGRPAEVWPHLKAGDQRVLRYAIAFQAAWMKGRPEALVAMDVASAGQGGESFTPRDTEALYLAPITKRLLRRLSWRRRQTSVPVSTAFARDLDEEEDLTWSPS